jgi:hypothetical protein
MINWISFLIDHKEAIASLLIAIVGALKLSAWGRAQATALDATVRVIESLNALDVKSAVAEKHGELPPAARDALTDAVATVDPKKPTPSFFDRILRELFRGWMK